MKRTDTATLNKFEKHNYTSASLAKADSGFMDELDYEIPRKAFHFFAGSIIPFIYLITGMSREIAVGLLLPFLIILAGSDVLRLLVPSFNRFYLKNFSALMRKSEENSLNTATYFVIASFFVISFFEKNTAITALLFLSVGDPAAALIGKRFGEVKIWGKTLEGAFACLQVCFLAALFFFPPPIALAGALTAAMVEFLPLRIINDNLRIPICSALVLSFLV